MMGKYQAILIDISGTLVTDGIVKEETRDWFHNLIQSNVPYLLVTNTTILTRSEIQNSLREMGVLVGEDKILNPELAAFNYCKQFSHLRFRFLFPEKELDWHQFRIDEKHPDYILLGDLEEKFTHGLLDELLNQLLDGAQLIALHKSRFWRDDGRLKVDLGGYVALLEFTSAKKAIIIGKPSPTYYEIAKDMLKLRLEDRLLMVGDDIYSDAIAAKKAGMEAVLVKTGKYIPEFEKIALENKIDIIDNLSEIDINNFGV